MMKWIKWPKKKKRKEILYVSLAIFFLASALFTIFPDGDGAEVKLAAAKSAETKGAHAHARRAPDAEPTEAKGEKPKGDPFTLAHEANGMVEKGETGKTDRPPQVHVPVQAPETAAAPEVPAPTLSGIISGEKGILAILSYGGDSRPLAPGEAIGPYRVTDIDAGGVSVTGPTGAIYLPLP